MYLLDDAVKMADEAGLVLFRDQFLDASGQFDSLPETLGFATLLFGLTGCPQGRLIQMMTTSLGMHPQDDRWIIP